MLILITVITVVMGVERLMHVAAVRGPQRSNVGSERAQNLQERRY